MVDGGPYSPDSLWQAIRTGIQQHSRSRTIWNNPVLAFFEHGHEAVKGQYYQDCLRVFQKRHPDAAVRNREHVDLAVESAARDEQGSSGSIPETKSPFTPPNQTHDKMQHLGARPHIHETGLKKDSVGLLRELAGLSW